ncbi:MAG: molybdenum cofactor biosynthesis protein MoaE [Pseudomonadota bacterium]
MISVSVQEAAFDVAAELNRLNMAGVGAQVSFTGIVRDTEGDLKALELEHYPAMTKAAIEVFCVEAKRRWDLAGVVVIHRYGKLAVGETIMMVAVASAHRRAAFEAADFLMDYLKSRAPFWKKEHRADGATWVEAKQSDEADLQRWDH